MTLDWLWARCVGMVMQAFYISSDNYRTCLVTADTNIIRQTFVLGYHDNGLLCVFKSNQEPIITWLNGKANPVF